MMRAFSLAEAQGFLQATLAGAPVDADTLRFDGVSTDTRAVKPGQLFVALRGDRFDGHKFLEQARVQGAVAAVVDTADDTVAMPQLVVADTVNALAGLARSEEHTSEL